jgi:hypothetical protein
MGTIPQRKKTGQKMTHLIEENGCYAQAVAKLLQEHPAILYHDRMTDDGPITTLLLPDSTSYHKIP